MAEIAGRRMTADIDGDFVVFLIGARFDKFHPVAESKTARERFRAAAAGPGR
jgi:hypothetical protein